MSEEDTNVSVQEAKQEILKAMLRGLNVTANAGHIRDLADAYYQLSTAESGGSGTRKSPATPIVQTK